MNPQDNLCNKLGGYFGGLWVSITLLVRCAFRTGNGSYLKWRNETAFGSKGTFPTVTASTKRKAIRAWAAWAWQQRKNVAKNNQ